MAPFLSTKKLTTEFSIVRYQFCFNQIFRKSGDILKISTSVRPFLESFREFPKMHSESLSRSLDLLTKFQNLSRVNNLKRR